MRSVSTAIFCCLLLSFNTVAAALMAVDTCLQGSESELHQQAHIVDMADMQLHHECSGPEQGWINATAQIVCDQGGECQMSGAVLPSTTTYSVASPEHVPPVFARPAFLPTYPTAFWRPPRY